MTAAVHEETELAKWRAQPLTSVLAAAHNGDYFAQAIAGESLCVSRDADEQRQAVHWLRKAAQAAVTAAQCRLGLLYGSGRILNADSATSMVWLERAAVRQNPRAMVALSKMLRGQGQMDQQVKANSFKWLVRAAQLGEQAAQVQLAAATAAGFGTAASSEKALLMLRQAGESLGPDAQYLSAFLECLVHARGPVSHGLEHLQTSADNGDARCQYLLAVLKLAQRDGDSLDAYAQLKRSAQSGFPQANFHLGLVLVQAAEVDTQRSGANHLQQAAAAGHKYASKILKAYSLTDDLSASLQGWIAARNCDVLPSATAVPCFETAVQCFALIPRELAEMQAGNGDSLSALALAKYHHSVQRASAKLSRKAIKWACRSVDLGSAEAALLLHTIGTEQEIPVVGSRTPQEWLELAAGRAYPEAQLRLAQLLLDGGSGEERQAFSLLVGAAGQGLAEAQYMCATALRDGTGTASDPVAAMGWLQKAAAQGHAAACRVLATSLSSESAANAEQKEELLAQALMAGDEDAPSLLVALLVDDIGKSSPLSKELLSLGLKRKSHHAHELYASFIMNSPETEKFPSAVKALRFAARSGSSSALHLLGRCYWRGEGVAKNEQQAQKLLQKAATAGNDAARFDLGRLLFETLQYDEALHCFCLIGDAGHVEGAYMAGYIQMKQLAANNSAVAALLWFKIAADSGHAKAQAALRTLAQRTTASGATDVSAARPPQKRTPVFQKRHTKAAHEVMPGAGKRQPSAFQSVANADVRLSDLAGEKALSKQRRPSPEQELDIVLSFDHKDSLHGFTSFKVGEAVVLISYFSNRHCPVWHSQGVITEIISAEDPCQPQFYGFKANRDAAVLFVPQELLRGVAHFGSHTAVQEANTSDSPAQFRLGDTVWVREASHTIGWQEAKVTGISLPQIMRPCYTYSACTAAGERMAGLTFEMGSIRPVSHHSQPCRFKPHQSVWVPWSAVYSSRMAGSVAPVWAQAEIVQQDAATAFPFDTWNVRCGESSATIPWQDIREFGGMMDSSPDGMDLVPGAEALLWTVGRGLQVVQRNVLIEGVFVCSSKSEAAERCMLHVRVNRGQQVPYLVPLSMISAHPDTRIQVEKDTIVDLAEATQIASTKSTNFSLPTSRNQEVHGGCVGPGRAMAQKQPRQVPREPAPRHPNRTKVHKRPAVKPDSVAVHYSGPTVAAEAACEARSVLASTHFNSHVPNSELKSNLEAAVAGGVQELIPSLVEYYRHHGLPSDKAHIPHLLQTGVNAGQADCLAQLAHMHETGLGVGRTDGVKAARMYKQALTIDRTCRLAAARLGRAHATGSLGERVQFSSAIKLLRVAKADDSAAVQLAELLCSGPNPTGDSGEIRQLLEPRQHLVAANLALAAHLLELGTADDHTAGRDILSRLAKTGNETAVSQLAQLDAPAAEFVTGDEVRVTYNKNGRRFVFRGFVTSVQFVSTLLGDNSTKSPYKYKVALEAGGFCSGLDQESLTALSNITEKAVQWGEDQVHDVAASGKQRKLSQKGK